MFGPENSTTNETLNEMRKLMREYTLEFQCIFYSGLVARLSVHTPDVQFKRMMNDVLASL
jgi:hypothetical protein